MPELSFDEFVEALVPDPGSPPSLVALDGYLGRGLDDEHVRVYRDRSLRFWIEVPRGAVRLTERIDTPHSLGPMTLVWIDGEASLTAGTVETRDELREFFEEPFTAAALYEEAIPEFVYPRSVPWSGNPGTRYHYSSTRCI
jgi:hypothetical protein